MREFVNPSFTVRHPHLNYLTGLRFLAALCIFSLHASDHGLISSEFIKHIDLSKSVSFFFVLSGFVLSYAYESRTLLISRFYLDRISRVWPITFISLIFTVTLLPTNLYLPFPGSLSNPGWVLLSNIFCLQSLIPIPSYYFGYNAVAWSISTELIFYLLFPFINRFNKAKIFVLFLILSFLVSFGSYLLSLTSLPFFSQYSFDSLSIHGYVYINPLFRLPEFILGILSFKITLCFKSLASSRHIFCKYVSAALNCRFVVDILCISLIFICFYDAQPLSHSPVSIQITISQFKSALGFSSVIILLFHFNCILRLYLSSKLLLYLGRISFSFYLIHQPIMIRLSNLGGLFIGDFNLLGGGIMTVFVWSILLASCFFYLVEKPSIRLLRSLYLS